MDQWSGIVAVESLPKALFGVRLWHNTASPMKTPLLCLLVLALGVRPLPAAEPESGASLEGRWLGTVRASENQVTEIGFALQRAADGKLHLRFHMPAMHVFDVDVGPVVPAGGVVDFPPLDVRLVIAGDRLTGTFAKAGLPIEARRCQKFEPAPPPPDYAAGPAPLWSHPLGAGAWASPVVQDGLVYLGTIDGRFHALRAADGMPVWDWTGPNPIYGTALVTADRVCFLDSHSELVGLDRAEGTLRWHTPLHAGSAPENGSFNHRTAVPIIDGNVIFVGSADGAAYALDAGTGAVRWRQDVGAPIYARATIDGDRIWFASFAGAVLALDRATGREITRFRLPGPVVSAPILVGGILVEGCRDYMLYGIKPADGTTAWRYSYWFSWVESTPALSDGLAYIGASDFSRITAFTPATGGVAWSTDVHGMSWGTPLVTRDTVYAGTAGQRDALIRHQGALVALDRSSGAVRWSIPVHPAPGAPIFGYAGSPAESGSAIIAAAVDGMIAAYPAATPPAKPGGQGGA